MTDTLASKQVRIWVLLVALMFASLWLGHNGGPEANTVVTAAIMGLAFAKARLVILHFMEVAQAPVPLRLLLELWCALVCGGLIVLLTR